MSPVLDLPVACLATGRPLPDVPFALAAVAAALARIPRLPAAERDAVATRHVRPVMAEHGLRWCGGGRRRSAYRAPGGWVVKHVWHPDDVGATAREVARLALVHPEHRAHFAEPFDLGGGVALQPYWPPDHARYDRRRREILGLAARYGIARDLTEDNVGWRGERGAIIDWECADDACG